MLTYIHVMKTDVTGVDGKHVLVVCYSIFGTRLRNNTVKNNHIFSHSMSFPLQKTSTGFPTKSKAFSRNVKYSV